MKANIAVFSMITTFFLFLLFMTGCTGTRIIVDDTIGPSSGPASGPPPWAPAHGYRAKHQYRYYPDPKVYFDTGRNRYFYFSGGQWQVSSSLPGNLRINFNDYVTLEMDTDRPYLHHSEIESRYPPGKIKNRGNRGKGKGRGNGPPF